MAGRKALIGSGIAFVAFASNVVLGSMGGAQFLGDLGELGLVILSVILFVVAIIQKENQANADAKAEG